MISKIITRNDTTDNWNDSSVPLAEGQFGYDTIKKILKIGDGSTLWNGLPALGGCTDAGVTHGFFYGRDNTSVSFNVGSSSAKKILIFCESGDGAFLVKAKCIYTLVYDFALKKGSLTYQGATEGYIGRQTESAFSVTCKQVDGDYIYTVTHTDSTNSRLFQNGLKYSWYCITHDVPANYSTQNGNFISGSFVGDGKTSATFYCGFDTVKSVYVAATPSATIQAPAPAILTLNYSGTDGGFTYQGQDAHYIGHKPVDSVGISVQDGYLTVGSVGSSANFPNGIVYTWVAFSDEPYKAPAETKTIYQNGYNIDVAKYAFVDVLVEGGETSGFTQTASGSYPAPSSDTLLNQIAINVGFKPRVFLFMIQGTGSPQINNNTNLKVTSSVMVADETGNILYAGTNFGYKKSSTDTTSISGYTENDKNIFYPTETGVRGGNEGTNNVYVKSGATYNWYAFR